VAPVERTSPGFKEWEFPEIVDMIMPHWQRAKKDAAAWNKKNPS
jgi:hypothetical protein